RSAYLATIERRCRFEHITFLHNGAKTFNNAGTNVCWWDVLTAQDMGFVTRPSMRKPRCSD
ncbi:MAG: hypothetical protein FWD12_12215, partial [Alphaproteobacteria bacterium]|nr:hypothetical protein [Alphaproteobacteria bacterium]